MTHCVVDALEVVQVSGDQAESLIFLQEVSHELARSEAVGKSGEPVCYCLFADAVLVIYDLLVAEIDDRYRDDDHDARKESGQASVVVADENINVVHRQLQYDEADGYDITDLTEKHDQHDDADVSKRGEDAGQRCVFDRNSKDNGLAVHSACRYR